MYKVKIEKQVQKIIEKIDEPYYSNVKTSILNLAKNPLTKLDKMHNQKISSSRRKYHKMFKDI